MKVLMAVRDLKYGFGTHANFLVSALEDQGVEVSLFVAQNDYAMAQLGRYLSDDYKDHDVLHIHGTPYLINKQPIPTVVTAHSTMRSEIKWDRWNFKFRVGVILEEIAMVNPDAFISVNSCLVDDIRALNKNADITIIPNGVDFGEFDTYPQPEKRLIYLLSGGRLIKRKRFEEVFQARNNLGVNRRIILFGDGPRFNNICKYKQEQDYLTGWVERDALLRFYLLASMFISSSGYEAGPLTILEAMTAKCPIISSDIPAIKGVVVHEKTGLVYPLGDINKLSENIKRLIDDEELGRKLADNAYEHIQKHHRWEDIAKATIGVYERVMEMV